jgi:hypothetical protein
LNRKKEKENYPLLAPGNISGAQLQRFSVSVCLNVQLLKIFFYLEIGLVFFSKITLTDILSG